jgi:hypothetical protein
MKTFNYRLLVRIMKNLPDVTLSEFDGVRCMHFDSPWIQGTMTIKQPFAIELDYVRRMMAWLLFVPLSPHVNPCNWVWAQRQLPNAVTKFWE